ncbi:MAG: hypothetical protein AAGK04_03245 [Planctomycetota bacterium]
MHRCLAMLTAILLPVTLSACGESGGTSDAAPATDTTTSAPWMLAAAPEGAQPVTEIKASAREGDRVIMRARIGGRVTPMNPGSPVFTVMDLAIPYCPPEEGCPTPWDYCCETPETILANAATVQVVGSASKPTSIMPDAAGLEPLDEIIVVGAVGPRPNANVLTIRAESIYAVPTPER